MNPLMLNLIICLAGSVLWISALTIFSVWISKAKKQVAAKGLDTGKVSKSYVFCIVICAVVCALPYLILFKPYITAILEGCGILGTWSLMKERLQKLKEKLSEN